MNRDELRREGRTVTLLAFAAALLASFALAGNASAATAPDPGSISIFCQLCGSLPLPQPIAAEPPPSPPIVIVDPCKVGSGLCAPSPEPIPLPEPIPDPCQIDPKLCEPIPCPLAGTTSTTSIAIGICLPPPCPLLDSASTGAIIVDICPPPCPLPLAGASNYPIPLICPPPPPPPPPPPCPPPDPASFVAVGVVICPPPPCPLLDGGALAFPIIDICPPPEKLLLGVLVLGAGNVKSDPAGINCPGDCFETYPTSPATLVKLTETPDSGFAFKTWGGACASAGTATECSVTMDASKFVSAVFEPVSPPPPSPEEVRLVVAPGGNGTITSADGKIDCGSPGPASDRIQQAVPRARAGLGPKCVASYQTGDHVELTATAQDGWEFTGWGGGCSGTVATCSFTIKDDTLVKGSFRPERQSGPAAVDVEQAAFVARWEESVAHGWLRLSGRARHGGILVVRLARIGRGLSAAGNGSTFRVPVRAGHFRAKIELPPGLLPGRYVVRVTSPRGGAGRRGVIELAAPPEGVVSSAFLSATQGGRPATSLTGAQSELWASFSFAARPRAGLPITISWLGPDGKLAAPPAELASGPNVGSFIRVDAAGGFQKGTWKVVLAAGTKVVKTVSISIS